MLRDTGRVGVLITVLDIGAGGTGELDPILEENGIPLSILGLIQSDVMNISASKGINIAMGPLLLEEGVEPTYNSVITLPENFFSSNEENDAIRSYINMVK